MAHFAEIDENNIVLRVLVVPDEQEDRGQEYLAVDCNLGGTWIQTSFNGKIRKRFAGPGGTYNQELDAFLTPKPYPSWLFDENEADWIPPTAKPDAGVDWYWSEDELKWLTW
jgi:hypothetical protein